MNEIMMIVFAIVAGGRASDAVPALELSTEIVAVAKAYDVDPELLARIVIHESKGRENAYNNKSDDYGLMQIHGATAHRMGIDRGCLLTWKCNLRVGAQILKTCKRPCHYNLGPRQVQFGPRSKICLKYETKLASL